VFTPGNVGHYFPPIVEALGVRRGPVAFGNTSIHQFVSRRGLGKSSWTRKSRVILSPFGAVIDTR
jgi:hypothetical protein